MRGSQKVTLLAVFFELLGVGDVGMVTATMCEWATRFGTLNPQIPSCSEVVYESRIWGDRASSNTKNQVGYDPGTIA